MREEIRRQAIITSNLMKILVPYNRSFFLRSFFLAIFILVFFGWSQGSQAQEYPTQPITLLISYAPGGGVDLGGRMMAEEGKKILGQEIIPVNKPGGAGAVAAGILASSKGDGYTLFAGPTAPFANIPHMESVTYDALKDFIHIIQYGDVVTIIVVSSDSPYKSLRDLIDFARKNPGKVSYGSPGVGMAADLAMELVKDKEKVDIPIIPFTGGAPAVTALLGGHISACGASQLNYLPFIKAGKVRALATTADKRLEALPDVPTFIELGYPHGGLLSDMYLITAPKGTPPTVIKKLEGAFRNAMKTQEFLTLAKSLYFYVENPLSGQKLQEFIEGQYTRNGELIRKAKLGK